MDKLHIREARREDTADVYALYRQVARTPGGLARLESEITTDYIEKIQQNAALSGLMLLAIRQAGSEAELAGAIHAWTPPLFCFSHVLSDLTIAVHPAHQGAGVGRALFTRFMEQVAHNFPHILRVELISRASNRRALDFYQSLGFVQEGELQNRIQNIDGSLESDIPMAWTRSGPA